jgi:predicted nucleic acid-binding protein
VLPAGRRRTELEATAGSMFKEDFHERVLPFDGRAAAAYAQLFATRRQMGRPIATVDLIVASTARVHDAAVVTRDAGGFEGCGLVVIDPWTAS